MKQNSHQQFCWRTHKQEPQTHPLVSNNIWDLLDTQKKINEKCLA